ncbi:bacteriohemerythrin [Anaerophaga thermohalophila]|jgi:hemerythrin|uniref:bacteriohemerythrin n=1 Tax=Anaerophaga thermohalophila TaxID=177400 RepID=UPI0003192F65|nr:bacteriohemerythrin [Anaerophaga thermohalophila]
MLIQWTKDLSVGNEKIDKEHQRWVEILNDFYDGIKQGKSKEKLEELLQAMLDYTRYHFKSEEAYMESFDFPGLEDHRKLHNEYADKIAGFYEKLRNGKLILSVEVTNFLKSWLINHIKGVDQQYADFVAKKK